MLARQQGPSLLFIARHIVHEGSFHAFNALGAPGLSWRHPGQVFGVPDHLSLPRVEPLRLRQAANMIVKFDRNMQWGICYISSSLTRVRALFTP